MKVAREIVEKRPEEITAACRKLYAEMSFQEITLNEISKETSLSRPAIYNYFQTKEEIFLALLDEEYALWNADLEAILSESGELTAADFACRIAGTLQKRKTLLRILCMNLYDIEEHSRMERLVQFKKQYGRAVELIRKCLARFFPSLSEEDRTTFVFEFFPFMYGIYPYAEPTEKQKEAMEKAGISTERLSIYEMARRCVNDLLTARTGGKE